MAEFSLFGFGAQGLPGEVDLYLVRAGAVERLCEEIIAACQAKAGEDRRRWGASSEHMTLAYTLVAWHTKRKLPLPACVLETLAYVMGQVNLVTQESLAAADVRARIGLPTEQAGNLPDYLLAAQLDGAADAAGGAKLHRDALGHALRLSGKTIDAWRRQAPYISRRKFVAALKHQVAAGPVPRQRDLDDQTAWIRKASDQILSRLG